MILAGIYSDLEIAQEDITFKRHWSLVCEWGEESRYLMGKSEKEATNFVISIGEINKWIKEKL